MPRRTVRAIDWFWIALYTLAGTGSILLSVLQLTIIANGAAPARVYRDEFVHGFYIFRDISGIILGLVVLALGRIHFIRRSQISVEP